MSRQSKPFLDRVKRWFRGDLAELPLAEQLPYLAKWFEGQCGQELLKQEKQILDAEMPRYFGYHLLNLSVSPKNRLTEQSPIHKQFSLSPIKRNAHPGETLAEFSALPIESDSVDVVLLHHILEFSHNPHQVLKEVNRVLVHRGHVIIVSFNTFSLFGIWKRIGSLFSRSRHWQHSSLGQHRLTDWFKLLDLEKTRVHHTFYRPPFSSPLLLKRSAFLDYVGKTLRLPLGGVYIIIARKDVCGVTPIKSPWEKVNAKRIASLPGIQPAPKNFKVGDTPINKKVLH